MSGFTLDLPDLEEIKKKTKQELVQRIYDALEPGGYLFIGTTETLNRNTTPFEIIQPSIFRKRE